MRVSKNLSKTTTTDMLSNVCAGHGPCKKSAFTATKVRRLYVWKTPFLNDHHDKFIRGIGSHLENKQKVKKK